MRGVSKDGPRRMYPQLSFETCVKNALLRMRSRSRRFVPRVERKRNPGRPIHRDRGLIPAIHAFLPRRHQGVGTRDKPGMTEQMHRRAN